MASIYRFLTDDGLVGDGSNYDLTGAADVHWVQPPAGEDWAIERIVINIRDSGTVNADTFGALTALTNGCKIQVRDGAAGTVVKQDLLDGKTIKNNGDFAAFCYDMTISTATAGDKAVSVRWTFARSGEPVILRGGRGERLVVETQDDTTGLVEFTVMAQGRKL